MSLQGHTENNVCPIYTATQPGLELQSATTHYIEDKKVDPKEALCSAKCIDLLVFIAVLNNIYISPLLLGW